MKLAVQESMLPGVALAEKVALAEDLGFEGVELIGHGLTSRVEEIRLAFKDRRIRPSTICAGYPGTLVTADPSLRQMCRQGILELLEIAAEFEMVGLIVVPVFNHLRDLPDLTPVATAQELGEQLLIAQLQEIAPAIERLGGPRILLEPLNRYEADFLTCPQKAAKIVREVNSPAVAIMCDLFHMNIEQPDTPATLEAVADCCRHIHLADNTRSEPGSGCIDFAAAFDVLKANGYDGYMALECGLSGAPAATLAKTVAYLRSCL